jgi:hypothetical protein
MLIGHKHAAATTKPRGSDPVRKMMRRLLAPAYAPIDRRSCSEEA